MVGVVGARAPRRIGDGEWQRWATNPAPTAPEASAKPARDAFAQAEAAAQKSLQADKEAARKAADQARAAIKRAATAGAQSARATRQTWQSEMAKPDTEGRPFWALSVFGIAAGVVPESQLHPSSYKTALRYPEVGLDVSSSIAALGLQYR